MLEESLDWPRIESAATPTRRKSGFAFDATSRKQISDALVRYVDESSPRRRPTRVAAEPAAAAIDPLLARRIQHHVANLCNAARLDRNGALSARSHALDISSLDRETTGLSAAVNAAIDAARRLGPETTASSGSAFSRLVLRLAAIYEKSGGAIAQPDGAEEAEDVRETARNAAAKSRKAKSTKAQLEETAANAAHIKPDRAFTKFLRALLLDAQDVLLGLPEEPSLQRGDGTFARKIRTALERINNSGMGG